MQHVSLLANFAVVVLLATGCTREQKPSGSDGTAASAASTREPKPVDLGKVRLSLSATDTEKYKHFLSDKKLTDTISYQSPDLDTAQVVDAVLISKALTLGGIDTDFEMVTIPNSERERAMVVSGELTVSGTSQWDWWADANTETVYKSDVVVPNGTFEKGLYTSKERAAALTVESSKDWAKFTCVSNRNWRVDWKTLSRLGFKNLQMAPNTESMFKMVDGGHADFTVQSFSGKPDLSITVGGITLYPVKGWKVALDGSRHFVVSKKNPHGAVVFAGLQKGLASMHQSGEVARALTESGFFNVNVKTWRTIQPQ